MGEIKREDFMELCSAEYLIEVRSLGARIDRLQEIIQTNRSKMLNVSAAKIDGMPHGSNAYADAIPDAVARFQELIGRYVEELNSFVEMQREAYDAITSIGNKSQEDVLILYYVLRHSWDEIAEELFMSKRNVLRIRKAALVELYGNLPESAKRNLPDAID